MEEDMKGGLKIGDVVMRDIDPQLMTVERLEDEGVRCVWFDGAGELHRGLFLPGELVQYDTGNDIYYGSRGCKDGCGPPIITLPNIKR